MLTMLGIVIGISSVILMVSVGQAAQNYILNQVASFGSDQVFISNGRGDVTENGPPSKTEKQSLTEKDYEALKKQDWVKAAIGEMILSERVSFGGVEQNAQLYGATPDEIVVYSMLMQSGRFIAQEDLSSRAKVVVLGSGIAKKFLGDQDPVGRLIKIGRLNFRVIGVMAPAGTRFFTDLDKIVYVPYTACMDIYGRTNFDFLGVKTGSVSPSEAKNRIRIVLRETHKIDNPTNNLSKDDFKVTSQEDSVKSADTIGSILQILLGSIASISLFVAGIGIMNIMYVTVTERTREIGLRKAIGATKRDLLGQFLGEAVILTVTAGVIGIILGVALTWLSIFTISQFQAGWSFVLPWNGIVWSFGVSAFIGIVFGFFPARRAAGLNPIEALHYE